MRVRGSSLWPLVLIVGLPCFGKGSSEKSVHVTVRRQSGAFDLRLHFAPQQRALLVRGVRRQKCERGFIEERATNFTPLRQAELMEVAMPDDEVIAVNGKLVTDVAANYAQAVMLFRDAGEKVEIQVLRKVQLENDTNTSALQPTTTVGRNLSLAVLHDAFFGPGQNQSCSCGSRVSRFWGTDEVHAINLNRRPDRWENFKQKISNLSFTLNNSALCNPCRFAAYDGRAYERVNLSAATSTTTAKKPMLRGIKMLFEYNDFHWHPGVVGAAMSHMGLWKTLADHPDPHVKSFLILEDDVYFYLKADEVHGRTNSIMHKWTDMFQKVTAADPNWGLIFLGYNDYQPISSDNNVSKGAGDGKSNRTHEEQQKEVAGTDDGVDGLVRLSTELRDDGGGAYGYALSRRGARQLLARVAERGMRYGVDRFMIYQFDVVRSYLAWPHIVHSPVHHPNVPADSDIQHDFLDYISQEQAKELAAARKLFVERSQKLTKGNRKKARMKKLKRTQRLLQRVTGGPTVTNLAAMCQAMLTKNCGRSGRPKLCTKNDFLQDLESALGEKQTKERLQLHLSALSAGELLDIYQMVSMLRGVVVDEFDC